MRPSLSHFLACLAEDRSYWGFAGLGLYFWTGAEKTETGREDGEATHTEQQITFFGGCAQWVQAQADLERCTWSHCMVH